MATTKQDTLTPYEQKFSSDTIKQVKTEFGGFLMSTMEFSLKAMRMLIIIGGHRMMRILMHH